MREVWPSDGGQVAGNDTNFLRRNCAMPSIKHPAKCTLQVSGKIRPYAFVLHDARNMKLYFDAISSGGDRCSYLTMLTTRADYFGEADNENETKTHKA